MNINELFEVIEEKLQEEDLKGEFELQGKSILWTYDGNSEEEEESLSDYEEDEDMFGFSTQTTEELLIEAFQEDAEKLEELLDEIDEYYNWNISEFEINENKICFYITPIK
jgi:hypothetical protein